MIIMPPQVFSAKKTFAATFFPEMPGLCGGRQRTCGKSGQPGKYV
ncbi:hypothetical protein HMPREF3039_02893 [Akkermansia sp. KLE1798]|nr:hypothetical protein HMPREF3039_02893 [Akkermansia sp. KLE1798]KZA03025.1 hypothetical protein HMPREF1326_03294 [Akkermansia sp. KLE1605]